MLSLRMLKLTDPVSKVPMVGPVYVQRLKKLGIETVDDLIHHIPFRYQDYRKIADISKVSIGETVTVQGEIGFIKNQYTKTGKKMQLAQLKDASGSINVIWFNQPFLIRTLHKGAKVSLSGKVAFFGNKRSISSPEYEKLGSSLAGTHTGRLVPIYHETYGVSSKWLRSRIATVYPVVESQLKEFLDKKILIKHKLLNYKSAIKYAHYPDEDEISKDARRRLAFNELLFLHLQSLYKKLDWKKRQVDHKLKIDHVLIKTFINELPFKLTSSQERSVKEIIKDLSQNLPMNRLLEGDVGAGKTVVAAVAILAAFSNGYQSVIMAPTQILAQQHYETLNQIFKKYKVRVSLLTSSKTKESVGKTDVFVGTHALIHRKVDFDKVALVVIDEQHRFGVEQRAHLTKKVGKKLSSPHVLTMTATPIPRTIALTVYGDLDLSTIDELPAGRKKIKTWLVPPKKRRGAYTWIEKNIHQSGIQAFIICPLIEESESETMSQIKAATVEYEKLKKVFKNLKLGLLHGRLKAKQKDDVVGAFRKGKIHILVSTPVVEVGIDIPNATIMLIEAAERFGLAQLHQLRGRVGRGDKQSYCLLFSENRSAAINKRLSALQKTLSGFELAELDLRLRGPGEIFGKRQSGFSDLKIASWQDTDLIKKSKKLAEEVIKNPSKFSKLLNKLKSSQLTAN